MGIWKMPLRWGRSTLVVLASFGMSISPMVQPALAQQPLPPLQAPVATNATPIANKQATRSIGELIIAKDAVVAKRELALDIALDVHGSLSGEVRNAQGQLQLDTDVVLWQGNQMLQRTRTNERGQFRFTRLRGGMYRIATPDITLACRAWTAKLAPPSARQSLLVVANMYSARGQQPINEVFCFNPFLMGTIVAAAIAIPIAVHDDGDGQLSDGEDTDIDLPDAS